MAYVLALSTLYFLISSITGENTWVNDAISGFSNIANDSKSRIEVPSILTWFSTNFAYTTLLVLPFFSLASYLSFLGSNTNYLEHIVLNSYITGQQAIFYSIFLVLKVCIESEFLELIPVLVSISYTFWTFWQFFATGNRILNILRSVLTYALYIIFMYGLFFYILFIFYT